MKRITKLTASMAIALSTLLGAQQAQALAISASDGINTFSASDTDNDGFVSFFAAIGAWNFNVVTGLADPAIGTPELYGLHLNSINAGGGTGTLTVMITDTNITKSTAPFMTSLGGVTGGTTSFATYLSANNTEFSLDTLLSSSGSYSGAFSATDSGYINGLTNPYSMTLVGYITHDQKTDSSSFDYEVKVPEPMTLALFGAGLIGMGFVGRRKRQS
jgi:hypothetical protein